MSSRRASRSVLNGKLDWWHNWHYLLCYLLSRFFDKRVLLLEIVSSYFNETESQIWDEEEVSTQLIQYSIHSPTLY